MKKENTSNLLEDKTWKIKDTQYLFELQKFLDLADNIKDENLQKSIVGQMLKCDKCVTNLAEQMYREILKDK